MTVKFCVREAPSEGRIILKSLGCFVSAYPYLLSRELEERQIWLNFGTNNRGFGAEARKFARSG
jgi:hypothetical protein